MMDLIMNQQRIPPFVSHVLMVSKANYPFQRKEKKGLSSSLVLSTVMSVGRMKQNHLVGPNTLSFSLMINQYLFGLVP